jgi:hypothetical protein
MVVEHQQIPAQSQRRSDVAGVEVEIANLLQSPRAGVDEVETTALELGWERVRFGRDEEHRRRTLAGDVDRLL